MATRDFLNRAGPANKDPQWQEEHHKALFSLGNSARPYMLESDEVAEPATSSDEKNVYLVRLAGKREVPLENMSPTQYDRYKRSARSVAMGEIARGLDMEFLKENFGLWTLDEERKAEAEAAKSEPKGSQ